VAVAKLVPLATFDGAQETTWPWHSVDDPVMGGASHSAFHVDKDRHLGVWDGEVRIVPFLGEPGFCNLQAPGLYEEADFPDLTGTAGIVVRARQTNASGLHHFNVMLMTKGAKKGSQQGVYNAGFSMTTDMADHFVPWKSFKCSWRGQPAPWCPKLHTQLAEVSAIGIGTFFPGVAGSFAVEMQSMAASSQLEGASLDLATFNGLDKHSWRTESDPVMGGQSQSTFETKDGYGLYSGICRIVPSLKAPGFTIALTETPILHGKFPDVSMMDGLALGVSLAGGNITTFKAAFCDSRNPMRCQFQSYKADFKVPRTDTEVFLPWSAFSDKWSSYTGEHTSEHPPSAASLKSITQLQIWTEGVAGSFALKLHYVRARKASTEVTSVLYV